MAALPDDFFTLASFGTLAGCVTLTTVVTGGLFKSFGWPPARTGLIVSFLTVAAALYLTDKIADPKAIVVGFFNAFLVYLSSAGVSDALGGNSRNVVRGGRPFFRSWFN
jgi:hypothetical protein